MKYFRKIVLWLLFAVLADQKKILALLERIIALLTRRPVRLTLEGSSMNPVIAGAAFALVIRCLDSETPPVAVVDTNGVPSVTATPPDTVCTVSESGTPGVYNVAGVAGPTIGPVSLVATDGVLTSAAFTFDVIADPTKAPASLEIAES
jgi:hypothetical protein